MVLSRSAAVVTRQFYLVKGSPARIVPLFAWVALDIILWGFITRYLSTITTAGATIVPVLLGAVLMWDFFSRVMHGVTIAFFEDVWARNFLNVFATPITIGEYLTGLVASSIATSTIGLMVMLVLASAVFGLSFAGFGFVLVPAVSILFLFGIALGIVSCALVLRLGPSAEWFVWPIPGLLSPFAGVFYPISTLPAWMRPVSYALPPSYVFEAARSVMAGQSVTMTPLLWAAGLSVVYVLIGSWVFTSVYRRSVRTGLLARYSAESVS